MGMRTEARAIAADVGDPVSPAPVHPGGQTPPAGSTVVAVDRFGGSFDSQVHRVVDGKPVIQALRDGTYRLHIQPGKGAKAEQAAKKHRPQHPHHNTRRTASTVVDPGGPTGGPPPGGVGAQGGDPTRAPGGPAAAPGAEIQAPQEVQTAGFLVDLMEVGGRFLCSPPTEGAGVPFDGTMDPLERHWLTTAGAAYLREHDGDLPPGVVLALVATGYLGRCGVSPHGRTRLLAAWRAIRGEDQADEMPAPTAEKLTVTK